MLRISPNVRIDDKAYKDKLYTMKVLHSPEASRIIAYWLMGICLLFFITLFLPWQQNIRAEGELTALSPSDRPQTVETAIAGRIEEWRIREGQPVSKGDTLVRISEVKEKFFDPELVQRLQEQVTAKEENITNKIQKVEALNRQIAAMRTGLEIKLQQIADKIEQKKLKVISDSNDMIAARKNIEVQERQADMWRNLYEKDIEPLMKWETAQVKVQEARAKYISAQNKLNDSKYDLSITQQDLASMEAETLDKVSKAQSDRANTLAEISDSQGSLAKLKNELANMEIRSQQYFIIAPQDGYIVKALKSGIGETVKEGEALITVMPDQPDMAAALYIKAMDVPLLSVGRHVRLEFDGWPALQFSGWPSVSVGTFGGKVEVIDMVDSKAGKYRILITPDPQSDDDQWPEELRLGSGIYGWVMLDDVPVYFELWRQLNGFPPSLSTSQDGLNPSDAVKEGVKK